MLDDQLHDALSFPASNHLLLQKNQSLCNVVVQEMPTNLTCKKKYLVPRAKKVF